MQGLVHGRRPLVVVTGGAGFVGSHLVDALLSQEMADVTVIDNLSRGRLTNLSEWDQDARLRIISADVRDLGAMREALEGASLVYHLAAQATVMGSTRDAEYTFNTNVVGTYNILGAAAEHGVRRVVFASSREVYGEPVSLPVEESHPLLSINMYGATKVAGEALCRAFARERHLDTIILRLANAYGARDFGRVIPSWIEHARAGSDLMVYGGDQVIDFVWVGDVVEALLTAGRSHLALPPINVASGTGTKILDLAKRILGLCGTSAEIRLMPARSAEVIRFIGSTERMSQLLGLAPATDPLSHLPGMVRSPAGSAA